LSNRVSFPNNVGGSRIVIKISPPFTSPPTMTRTWRVPTHYTAIKTPYGLATKTGGARARRRAVLDCVACAILVQTFVSVAGRAATCSLSTCYAFISVARRFAVRTTRIFALANVPWPGCFRAYTHGVFLRCRRCAFHEHALTVLYERQV
jgi:hypothetical protein